jgi:hypothetical protein
MRRRSFLAAVGLAVTAALMFSPSAFAATEFGDNCVANEAETIPNTVMFWQFAAPGDPLPSAAPTAGVITKWKVNLITGVPFGIPVQMRVVRLNEGSKSATVISEASGEVHSGSNTFETRMPVQAGDHLALSSASEMIGLLVCENTVEEAFLGGALVAPIGTPTPYEQGEVKFRIPLSAVIEPDADGDGFGDETQDKCPTNAATQAPCPPPPAPTTLSATAAAQKGLATVTLTASAQASVTVGGTVKLGKAGTAKLSGGTQTVTPGTLAKFVVLFPAKLKAQLKKTPPSKKLTLELSATAPGATSTALKVKVKGQKKPKKHKK